jgi:hypothetical protein
VIPAHTILNVKRCLPRGLQRETEGDRSRLLTNHQMAD